MENLDAAHNEMSAALRDRHPGASEAMLAELELRQADIFARDGEYAAFRAEIRRSMSLHPGKKHDFTFLRTRTLERLTGSEAVAAEAMGVWMRRRNSPVLFPGVLEALAGLRRAGVQVGTLTDGNADPAAIQGLRDAVDFSASAVEAGAPKPDRKAFALCEARSGCAPSGMVMVGDNAEKDVAGARAAGWRAIWVRPSEGSTPAVGSSHDMTGSAALGPDEVAKIASAIVAHVSEIEDVLRSWARDAGNHGEPPPKKSKF